MDTTSIIKNIAADIQVTCPEANTTHTEAQIIPITLGRTPLNAASALAFDFIRCRK